MPAIVTGKSEHIEGENIRTLARIVGLDQVMLTQEDAGALTIRITSRGSTLYTTTITDTTNTGITTAPTKPAEWKLRGKINFDYTHSVATLAAGSPPFAFKGGRSYLIEYDFNTLTHGHVLAHHQVRILGSP